MSTVEKLFYSVLSGTQDNNIRFSDMYNYEIIIYWSNDDNAYIAEVPELPGCMADGKTRTEVIENIEQIIEEWVETATESGREIPKPKGRVIYA